MPPMVFIGITIQGALRQFLPRTVFGFEDRQNCLQLTSNCLVQYIHRQLTKFPVLEDTLGFL